MAMNSITVSFSWLSTVPLHLKQHPSFTRTLNKNKSPSFEAAGERGENMYHRVVIIQHIIQEKTEESLSMAL